MGVLVFLLMIIPMSGGSNMNLMRAESPGPSAQQAGTESTGTAKILYGLYMAITVLGVIMLCLCGSRCLIPCVRPSAVSAPVVSVSRTAVSAVTLH